MLFSFEITKIRKCLIITVIKKILFYIKFIYSISFNGASIYQHITYQFCCLDNSAKVMIVKKLLGKVDILNFAFVHRQVLPDLGMFPKNDLWLLDVLSQNMAYEHGLEDK